MKKFIINQKQSGTGSIHDIASDQYDREIIFRNGCKFAVVLSSYYGGKGYTTHKTPYAAAKASHANRGYSHTIIDSAGNRYIACGDELMMD